MNNVNPRVYITVSHKYEKFSLVWKELVKGKIQEHLKNINRSFSEEEYAKAEWDTTLTTISLSGFDFIIYIVYNRIT